MPVTSTNLKNNTATDKPSEGLHNTTLAGNGVAPKISTELEAELHALEADFMRLSARFESSGQAGIKLETELQRLGDKIKKDNATLENLKNGSTTDLKPSDNGYEKLSAEIWADMKLFAKLLDAFEAKKKEFDQINTEFEEHWKKRAELKEKYEAEMKKQQAEKGVNK